MRAKKYVYLSENEERELFLEVYEEGAVAQLREGWWLYEQEKGKFAEDAQRLLGKDGHAPFSTVFQLLPADLLTVARWSKSGGVEWTTFSPTGELIEPCEAARQYVEE